MRRLSESAVGQDAVLPRRAKRASGAKGRTVSCPTLPMTLEGKRVYIPPMAYGSAQAFAAAFRAIGLDAEPTPPSDERTRELGARHTSGDECYPAKVTVGDFMKLVEKPDIDHSGRSRSSCPPPKARAVLVSTRPTCATCSTRTDLKASRFCLPPAGTRTTA